MQLLRELSALQSQHGWLSDERLREFAAEKRLPLYRLEELVSFYPHFRRTPPKKKVIHLCRDICCAMQEAAEIGSELRRQLSANAAAEAVELHESSCLGRCDSAPAMTVNEVPLTAPSADEAETWITNLLAGKNLLPAEGGHVPTHWQCSPYDNGSESALSPYSVVRQLVASGEDVGDLCIARLKEAGLRGMGGAGFPAGRKWELVRAEPASPKYVICNADESEPGTFKDRVILQRLPHLVIEGLLLAGLTIGAETGILFLRHEYGPEREAVERALQQARQTGVLGENAAGSGRTFDIDIFISPGGYILGEETALLEALEDKRGEPRNRPPYPGQHGLWGQPTLINNVETFALSVGIVYHGPEWWQEQGRGESAGLKIVSVSGDVNRPGVYEIPLGLPVRELMEQAGGLRDGRALQAFLPGGASSNFLPADKAETPLDFEAMQRAGSMLGTGAVIVIGEERDLFALATNLVQFFRNESCGKCVPCRVGTEKAVELLQGVRSGTVSPSALSVLPELGETLQQTSICGLGQVALNPFLSLQRHFPAASPAKEDNAAKGDNA